MKPIIKFNGGIGAILCHTCRKIIKTNLTKEEFEGKVPIFYCNEHKKETIMKNKYLDKLVTLTKKTDLVFQGMHPNDVNVGFVMKGRCSQLEVGSVCLLDEIYKWWNTSIVTKIDEESNEIHTKNSVYTISIDEDQTQRL
jgi:hypothetical protein